MKVYSISMQQNPINVKHLYQTHAHMRKGHVTGACDSRHSLQVTHCNILKVMVGAGE